MLRLKRSRCSVRLLAPKPLACTKQNERQLRYLKQRNGPIRQHGAQFRLSQTADRCVLGENCVCTGMKPDRIRTTILGRGEFVLQRTQADVAYQPISPIVKSTQADRTYQMGKSESEEVANRQPEGFTTTIEPSPGWRFIDLRELWNYRELLYYLVRRDIKVRYAQSILGIGWAIIQPVFYMVVFTVIFGNLVEVDSEGIPYPIFSFVALVPWVYFSNALVDSSSSLNQNSSMLTKVYVPRLIFPLTAALGKFADFLIALVLIAGLAVWYGIVPTGWAVFLPVLIVLMVFAAVGVGIWLTALSVQYRDVRYALTFSIQGLLYVSPVVYPISLLPDKYRLLYSINPMVGVIEGFRAALLGSTSMPWDLIGVSAASTLVITVTGLYYFRRMERVFSDVV